MTKGRIYAAAFLSIAAFAATGFPIAVLLDHLLAGYPWHVQILAGLPLGMLSWYVGFRVYDVVKGA